MVSFQSPLLPNQHPNSIPHFENNLSKKRKWDNTAYLDDDHHPHPVIKPWMSSAIDLHLEIPLPSDWQRCLDIQSGEIHFFNTRTHKRTQRDPRLIEATPILTPTTKTSALVNLDLELNLAHGDHHNIPKVKMAAENDGPDNKTRPTLSLFAPSALPAADMDQQEMVAAACKRCHLLVMLCKSYPACPNCKFMHPPSDQSLPKFLKTRLSLLC